MISALKSLLLIGCVLFPVWSTVSAPVPLVNHGDTWRYHKGTNAAQANWKTVGNAGLDATWSSGAGGFGYGDNDDATALTDMANRYTTVFIRREINLASAIDSALHLQLTVDWDDAYIVYLDGAEIARSANAPGAVGVEPAATALATAGHEAAAGGGPAASVLDLGAVGSRLGAGTHVVAVIGLNDSLTSSDFSLIVDLAVIEPSAPALVAAGSTWRYFKGTNAPMAGWTTVADGALGASWASGPGGFGYADGDDATVLSDMRTVYTTIYIRQTFTVTEAYTTNLHALLNIDFDDGFVAYLDGVEVARQLVPGAPGVEPAHTVTATATHEASAGTGGNAPLSVDLGRADLVLAPGSHILALIGVNESLTSSDLSLIPSLSVAVPPPPDVGTITVDTTWTLAGSPYVISNNVTVLAGVTLTIEPGVTVLFDQGRGMTVRGRLLAEGTAANPITFTRNAGATTWNQIAFTANNTTSIVAHAHMSFFAGSALEANGTTLHLDTIDWTDSTAQVVDLVNCSIVLLNSIIPGGAGNEPVHFNGMPANGHAMIKGCVFGAPRGYNDSIDFTGGNRPGPIAQFIDNVFLAAVDDCFDMDATDAHIEGNIFMNVLQDARRDSSSNPITTGEGSAISELYIARNIFFNCEHILLLKDNGSAVVQNNTIVHLTTNALAVTASGMPIPPGIVLFGEPWRGRPFGAGAIFEGNIAYDLAAPIQADPFPLYDPAESFLVASRNIIQGNLWPGEGNLTADPMFVNIAGPMTAANIRSNLMLLAGSPAREAGPNGLDMGAIVPAGASISGIPSAPSAATSLSVRVAGPGIVAYRWRLNSGPWSPEIPLTNSFLITSNLFVPTNGLVTLTGLADGLNTFQAIGKNSAGAWQDTNAATTRTWTVESTPALRLSVAYTGSGPVTLTFFAEAGKTYGVLYKDSLDAATWLRLKELAPSTTGPVVVTDDAPAAGSRFYKVVSPVPPQ
jgi:hypothetical protein